jgi:hypothetical protein
MLLRLLTWLDSAPAHYWIVAWAAFAGFAALAFAVFLFPRERAWWQHPAVLGAAMLIVLFAFRWPVLFDNRQYPDPDESQFIAGALTLRHDPLFWKSVDGTTHGPLTEWPLLVALVARGSLDFTTARMTSVLLVWLQLISALLIFRHLFKSGVAALLVLPLLAVNAFTQIWSFVAYCSEHVPNTLIALGCWALITAWRPDGNGPPSFPKLFAAGVFFGAIPFAKLQAAPIAVVAVIAGGFVILFAVDRTQRLRALGWLIGGAATMSILILVVVTTCGIWSDFFSCYILDNLRYATANRFPPDRSFGLADAPRMLLELGSAIGGFAEFALWMTGFGLLGLFFLWRFTRWHRRWVFVAAAILLTAAFSAMSPGRPYLHYLQLIIFPLGLFSGVVAGALFSSGAARPSRFAQVGVVTAFLVCGLAPQIWWRAREPQPFIGIFSVAHGALVQSQVSREILEHARPGERLGIWGWMPMLWVETGMIQATRDGQTSRQIEPHPRREYYRTRFMQDLLRAQPPVFVDAVGPGNFVYEDRAESAHETFPELRDYIDNNYHLLNEVSGARIYVRNDRL